GDELREAMRSQRAAMHRLLGEAEQVAADAGLALTLEQQRRIHDTLETAASTEPDALREGTLQRELSPAGFDALLSGSAPIAPKAKPAAVEPKAGVAAVASKAASRKQAFEARAQEQKRLLQERRDRMPRQLALQGHIVQQLGELAHYRHATHHPLLTPAQPHHLERRRRARRR